uniref:Nicastrin n=2 Tax=Schistocephalus solidus TaxID=70667 RepID=A0A0V0J209_SCHSO
MLLFSSLIFVFILVSSEAVEIYQYIPQTNVSFCSRSLSYDGQVGCSSKYPSSLGPIFVADSHSNLPEELSTFTVEHIIVISYHLFLNRSLLFHLRNSKKVAGLVVFAPENPNDEEIKNTDFSENSFCPNGAYNFYNNKTFQCEVTPKWNPTAFDYATISWPFPVVLILDKENHIWNKTLDCYKRLNVNSTDDTRCSMEIRNFMSGIQSSQTCYYREHLLSYRLEQPTEFCSQIGGVNLMVRAIDKPVLNNTSCRLPNSTLLVLTRIDSRSMFDRKASSSLGVLPGVAVLTSVAAHLLNTPAFKSYSLKKDVLFAFLDNEAYDFMGSQRLLFDLTNMRMAARSGAPFTIESIESVLELSAVGLPDSKANVSTYFLISDPEISQATINVTSAIWRALNKSTTVFPGVNFVNLTEVKPGLPLPPTVSLQALLTQYRRIGRQLSHTVIFDRDGPPYADPRMDSFLDVTWPPESLPYADGILLNLANVVANAIYSEIVTTGDLMPPIQSVTPGELMDCFVKNPGCDLLRMHLEPDVVNFLLSLSGPIPTQGYPPIDGREWRLSHVVARLLMGLTGERLKECPPADEYGAYTYMYGYFNGSQWCYRSLIDTSTVFFFLDGGRVAAPGWVRSGIFGNTRYVRMYRSASDSLDNWTIALGTILTLLAAVVGIVAQVFNRTLFPRQRDSNHQVLTSDFASIPT